ncbi:hypothetical protein J0383_07790 [Flavobacterium endoglycinae]|uniref:Uncharacterized protein n=1 Tax=Flavobacterium endoglycinae TaxID=2816357 RepID=A0ABX7QJ40_9FLAO|nr:hypothetical protein [Flavobacterium endoglycinae]QSW90700.1 hypothetical protein J0383_07790 [Flavobacterium endoglycinae]
MPDVEELFSRVMKKQIQSSRFIQVVSGIATDITEATCTVQREGSPDLTGVRLNAIDDEIEDQVTIYPKDKSHVVVGIMDGLKTEAVVLKCSEVENMRIKCGGVSFIDVLSSFITEVKNAIINTPAGAGTVSPATIQKLTAVEEDFKKIFK